MHKGVTHNREALGTPTRSVVLETKGSVRRSKPTPKTPSKRRPSSEVSCVPLLVDENYSRGAPTELRMSEVEGFTVVRRLALGFSSEVFEITDNGVSYALKRSVEPYLNDKDKRRKMNEILILKRLLASSSEFVIRIVQGWEHHGFFYIKTEYCDCTLEDYLDKSVCSGTPLGLEEIGEAVSQIAQGLEVIHLHKIIHMDLKPSNVLMKFGNGFTLKIADFGISYVEGSELEPVDGDGVYLAPECLNGRFVWQSDVFSLGLISLEMVLNVELPKSGETWQRLRSNASIEELRGHKLESVILSMLDSDYRKRPAAKTVSEIIRSLN